MRTLSGFCQMWIAWREFMICNSREGGYTVGSGKVARIVEYSITQKKD